jgi:hypothetical protein
MALQHSIQFTREQAQALVELHFASEGKLYVPNEGVTPLNNFRFRSVRDATIVSFRTNSLLVLCPIPASWSNQFHSKLEELRYRSRV